MKTHWCISISEIAKGVQRIFLKHFKHIKSQPKWLIRAALIFSVVLGGVLGQQQSILPNQEIVLQFVNEDISLNDADHTIAIVEQELQRIGVSHIQISEQEDGRLVISYYSDTTVAGIKKILSEQKELALGFVSTDKKENPLQFPSKAETLGYHLNVYEIQDGQNLFSDLSGKCATELKSGSQRFLNPTFYIHPDGPLYANREQLLKVDVSFQSDLVITKDYRSHKIPEVRAGPFA